MRRIRLSHSKNSPGNQAAVSCLGKYSLMKSNLAVPPVPPPDAPKASSDSEGDQINQNIDAILEFYAREEQKISRPQRILERISRFIAKPVYLALILLLVALWMLANLVLRQFGIPQFDPAPYFWLQGIVGLGALLTATVVLSKQDRFAKLAEQREHLDLKVTLLTEQKVAKLIDLLEELRRDLPNVKDRHDPDAVALQHSMNPSEVLAALDERSELEQRVKDTVGSKEDAGKNAGSSE